MHPSSSQSPPVVATPGCRKRRFPNLYAFWTFARPHTIIGTSLSVFALYWMAIAELGTWQQGIGLPLVQTFLPALIACLCGNVYIVGLNQLEDIEIDRINKPHLPIASGEFSRSLGRKIVALMGGLTLILSAWSGVWLMATVWLSLLIGTAYSLPPIRLKRFPVWAALCIFSVRGAIVNLGLFLHFNHHLQNRGWGIAGYAIQFPPTVLALTLFILIFTFAIAIFKDIPDMEGDRRYNISTFTLRLGTAAVFNLARWVLTVCYLGMILVAPFLPGINPPFLVITHLLALASLWWYSQKTDLKDRQAIARCYQFIWKLFFLEYLIVPIACLLN